MKFRRLIIIMLVIIIGSGTVFAQDENVPKKEKKEIRKNKTKDSDNPDKDVKPMRSPFENGILMNRNTFVQPNAKSFEFVMQHRFGNINSEGFDLIGIFGPSNIRLGLNYAIWDKFQIGVGTSKNSLIQDLNWKWAALTQTRKNRIPLSISYYGNVAVEGRKKENYAKAVHRFSYYHEVIIGRKFHKLFTAQITFSYAHFNVVDSSTFIPEGSTDPAKHDIKHDNFGVSLAGRVKVSSQVSILFEYDHPLVFVDVDKPQPSLSIGVEIGTSAHAFQIVLGSYRSLMPQYDLVYNTNKFWEGDILLGFNITRLWNF